ncbi:MAG: HAMP domain-containing sensor histidine kinase [Bacillota bacterium]|nr:HAMP domain-containing sensor histidine kinase [Bacillota bacterium]
MRSIRTKLVANFMFVIIISVLILEILLINVIKQNYYISREGFLVSQIKMCSDIYLRYYADTSLYENVLNDVDTFWKPIKTQVQIIDLSGNVKMDSIGVTPSDLSGKKDVRSALNGSIGTWVGNVDYTKEEVMAVSCPLKSGSKTVAVLRLIASLDDINRDVGKITKIFIFIGLAVILVCGLLSILLANSIVGPLKEITGVAEKMSLGNYKIKSVKKNDDEIGRLSDTLNHMAEEILKKEQLKNDFISSVSHELRTPLTSIKGWAVTLKVTDPEDKEMISDGLDIIEKESDRLTSMVEELLDFSKYVSGKLKIVNKEVELGKLLEYIRIQLAPRAERDNIEFIVVSSKDLPTIISDENRLKQVFINILDNAFRFTPPQGRIVFDTRYDLGNVIFSIKDSGCGISAEELPKVRERFYKGKNEKSRNGIGLSICDELVNLMGGTMQIKSELGDGVEVVISLPVAGGVA